MALADDGVSAIQTYGYDAWGNLIESTGTDDDPFRFAGERFDQDTNLIYLRARWYEPVLGRFAQADTANGRNSKPAALNKYVYGGSDPVDFVDASGNDFSLGGLMTAVGTGALVGAIATPVYNHAIGKATTVGDVMQGAAVGAVCIAGAYLGGPVVAVGLTAWGIGTSGALVFEVLDDPGTTWDQRVAASALLLAAVAGPARATRFAGEMWGAPKSINDFRVLHDLGVTRVKAFFEANGFKVAEEVYVRNPYYKVGRRYDLVVRDANGDYIGIEYKGTQNAAYNPPVRQVRADGWIEQQGGEIFRFGGRSSRVQRLCYEGHPAWAGHRRAEIDEA